MEFAKPTTDKTMLVGCLKDKKILVAEDDDTNFFLLRECLRITEAQVDWVQNGLEAVDYFKFDNNANIVLMDIQMPVLNGMEAMSRIRKINSTIPIVALTAYAMHGDREKFLAAGFNDYMTKPFIQRDLIELLKYHC